MKITDDDVVRVLTYDGIPLERCVLINDVIPGFIDEKGQLMMTVIEDDKLADAARKLLRKLGKTHWTAAAD